MANDDYGRGGWDRDDRFGRGGRERNDWRGAGRGDEGGEYARWGRGYYRDSGSPGNYDGGNYGDEEYEAGYGDRERGNRLRDRERDLDRDRSWQGRGRGGGRGGYGPGGTWSSDRGGWGSPENDIGRRDEYGFEGGAGRGGYGGMPPGEGYDRFTGGGIGGPETEWGRGYGGGYGRSGEYGERGGRGAWGRGQQSGIGPEYGSSSYGGYGYSSGFSDMSQGRTSSYDADFGARSPRPNFAGRGPRNYRRSDERIEEEINEELTRSSEIDASDIEVRVAGGTVTLSGSVDNRHAKRLAEDLSESISGVEEVDNQLRVKRGAEQGATMTDREVGRSTARETGSRSAASAGATGGGAAGAGGTTSRGGRTKDRSAS